jgi:hypothetical protein
LTRQDQIGVVFVIGDKDAIWHVLNRDAGPVAMFDRRSSFLVNGCVHDRCCVTRPAGEFGIRGGPQVAKTSETFALTFRARSMPGRERGGFIQEEELGVVAGRHQLASSALEFEQADNPPRALEVTSDALLVVMQATAIAGQRSPCWRGHN